MRRPIQKLAHWALLRTWDTMVPDRWRWLSRHLPPAAAGDRLLDVGCGSGGFTIGAALAGCRALGLNWDAEQKARASRRAERLAAGAEFRVLDVRELDQALELKSAFSVVVLCEVIEHVLDDRRLVRAAADCLTPGGRLLLTTPNFGYRSIVPEHDGPFSVVEDGGHVRRGYTSDELVRLGEEAGLEVNELGSCSGLVSQKATWVTYTLGRSNQHVARIVTAPLHPLVSILDEPVTRWMKWPPYSFCMVATKPRDRNGAAREGGWTPGPPARENR
jgi:2-polyprenyl-3-methyl-5-hydroxy-6-metoxy-1,4-benzoquinol methylase